MTVKVVEINEDFYNSIFEEMKHSKIPALHICAVLAAIERIMEGENA